MIRLFNSLTQQKEPFEPRDHGKAGIYCCGPTVYNLVHVGNARPYVTFAVLRSWLAHRGLDVTLVTNITDVDDKIINKAHEEDRDPAAVADHYTAAYVEDTDRLGIPRPDVEPKATETIAEIIDLVRELIGRGHAYEADGSVYFKVRSFSEYGKLSGQRIDELEEGVRIDAEPGKADPLDFAVWKAAKPGEPSWESPWGEGRPGWHIECSAMGLRYLGAGFDVHGGGRDLIFPHHENEVAQSHGAGDGFAQYWLHNGWVTMSGEKMSKSLGNVVAIPEMLKKVRPVELRYYLGSAHYRSMLEYSEGALHEAAAGYRRIESFVQRVADRVGAVPIGEVTEEFAAALDDDLGVPAALAAVHNAVREGNTALEAGDGARALQIAATVRAMTGVLGTDPLDPHWHSAGPDEAATAALDVLVGAELDRRAAARAAKDWAVADEVRDRLAAAGVEVTDTPDGAQWALQQKEH